MADILGGGQLGLGYYDDGTAQYADAVTNIAGTGGANSYFPLLYGKKVLYDFYEQTIGKELCNTDYDSLFKSGGQQVKIRMAPKITTNTTYGGSTEGKGSTIVYEAPSHDSTYLTIDKSLYQAIAIDDIDKVQSDVDLFNMDVESGRKSLQEALDQSILTAIQGGALATYNKGVAAGLVSGNINLGTDTTTAYIGVDRTNALDKIVELCQVLAEQNVSDDITIVIPSWYETRLKLSDLKAADFTGDSTGTVRNGLLGSINGAKVYRSNNLIKGTNAFPVIATTKMASSFAAQLSKTDQLPIPDSFGTYWRTLFVYGIRVVRPEGVATMYAMPA